MSEARGRFGVSVASAVKRHDRLAGERDWGPFRIVEKPDLTLGELVAELQEVRGIRVARDTAGARCAGKT